MMYSGDEECGDEITSGPATDEGWPPEEGEDIPLDPDDQFDSPVKDEFPGGW